MNGLDPMAYQDNESVDGPCHLAMRNLGIVTFELGFCLFGLGEKIFFGLYLTVQLRIVDERFSFLGGILHLAGLALSF